MSQVKESRLQPALASTPRGVSESWWHGSCGLIGALKVRGGEIVENERDRAIRLARQLYDEEKRLGTDLSDGPCLSEEIIPNWCVDVAHTPRQPVDDLPENQCSSYRSGHVRHFVELDTDGKVVRAV